MHTEHDSENLASLLSRDDALIETIMNQSKSAQRIVEEQFTQHYNDIKNLYEQ